MIKYSRCVTIQTKYIPATARKGARVKASANGHSVYIPYPHELNNEEAHGAAAQKLCDKMEWTGNLIGGSLKKGMVFVLEGPAND